MAEKFDVKETLELVEFGCAMLKGYKSGMEDGKWDTISDSLGMIGALRKLEPAIEGIGEIGLELSDLSNEELKLLEGKVLEYFPELAGTRALVIAQLAIGACVDLYKAYTLIK